MFELIVEKQVKAKIVLQLINLKVLIANNGIVYEPSKNKPFARGLPYVVISRVTDLEKVALLLPIRPDHLINKHFIAENKKLMNSITI